MLVPSPYSPKGPFDVVIQTSEGHQPDVCRSSDDGELPFRISSNILVCRLDHVLANEVMDACEPAGREHHSWGDVLPRQFCHLWALVREDPPDPRLWDTDDRLQHCVALSRLVHPTSLSLFYAAKINLADAKNRIVAADCRFSAAAFVISDLHCKSLSKTQWEKVATLVNKLDWNKLPERVRRAFWLHETMTRARYRDDRWAFLCTAFEALVHTNDGRPPYAKGLGGSTKQFKARVPLLAKALGEPAVTEDEASSAYHSRSLAVHGFGIAGTISPQELSLLEKLDRLLRAAIERSIEDSSFSANFANDTAIRSAFPLMN